MAQQVTFDINFNDKFSGVTKKLSKSLATTTRKMKQLASTAAGKLSRALTKVKNKAKEAGFGLQQMGDKSKQAGLAAAAGIGLAIFAFDKQALAEAKVSEGLRNLGKNAKVTAADLGSIASELQGVTRFGDEDILSGLTAPLTAVPGLSKDAFKAIQQGALDAAAVSGKSGEGLEEIGKKLANILKGAESFDSLKELSPSLAISPEVAKRLAELPVGVKRTAALMELLSRNQGQAAKAAETGAGGFIQLFNALGDVVEAIGAELTPILAPFISVLKTMAEKLAGADSKFTKIAAVGLLFVAVMAPVVAIAIAVAGAIAFIGAPVILIALKIAALVTGVVLLVGWLVSLKDEATALAETLAGAFDFSGATAAIDNFFSGAGGKVAAFFGIGATTETSSKTDVNVDINLKDPGSQVASVKTKTGRSTRTKNTGAQSKAAA